MPHPSAVMRVLSYSRTDVLSCSRALVLSFLIVACGHKSGPAPDKVVATVNQQPITIERLAKAIGAEGWKYGLTSSSDDKTKTKIKMQILESLIKDQLLIGEAERRELSISSEELQKDLDSFKKLYQSEEAWEKALQERGITIQDWENKRRTELLTQKLVSVITDSVTPPAEEEVEKYYNAHRQQFVQPEQIRVRQIVTDSLDKAQSVRKKILVGEKFEDLAEKYSLSPDRKKGGDLGFFSRGNMPKEFDVACFNLKSGEVSEVVSSTYGYHIFQLTDRKPPAQLSLEAIKEKVMRQMTNEKGKGAFEAWYQEARKTTEIFINQVALDSLQPTLTQGIDEHE